MAVARSQSPLHTDRHGMPCRSIFNAALRLAFISKLQGVHLKTAVDGLLSLSAQLQLLYARLVYSAGTTVRCAARPCQVVGKLPSKLEPALPYELWRRAGCIHVCGIATGGNPRSMMKSAPHISIAFTKSQPCAMDKLGFLCKRSDRCSSVLRHLLRKDSGICKIGLSDMFYVFLSRRL